MSSFFLKAKQWLVHGGSFQLRPYELACLEAWRKTLTGEALGLLDQQLKRLTVYQRYGKERLLCFYDMTDKSCSGWPKEILFPCQMDEVSVARLQLSPAADSQVVVKADMTLCRGRFFGIEFNTPPKCLQSGVEVVNVKTLVDPMRQREAEAPISLSEISGELREQLRRLQATGLRKPLPPGQREELVQAIDSKLPEEYRKLVAVTDGATISGWRIYGLAEVRRIVQPEGNFYLLAEATNGRALGIIQEASDPQLYVVSGEGEKPKPTGQSLLASIERDLSDNPTAANPAGCPAQTV
jgi:hypothetical protein